MSKRFHTMPKGEARPLGTKAPRPERGVLRAKKVARDYPKRVKSSKPLSKDAALLQADDSITAALLGMPEVNPAVFDQAHGLQQHNDEVKSDVAHFDHEEFRTQLKDSLALAALNAVDCHQMNEEAIPQPSSAVNLSRSKPMTLVLKSTSKNGKNAMYSGAANVLRIPVNAFVGGTAPASFSVSDGVFADPKVKLTADERKAANKLKPKPTAAERVAKMEERLARAKAKLAAV